MTKSCPTVDLAASVAGLVPSRSPRSQTSARQGSRTDLATAGPRDDPFRRYVVPELDALYRVALTLTRHPHEAEDLVQETMLRAFRAIDRFDGRYPRAWLLTIMRNININIHRKSARQPALLRAGDEVLDRVAQLQRPIPTPEAAVMEQAFDHAVTEALDALPGGFRQAIELVDVDGRTYDEAATLLGIPIGTVTSRLHRGRTHIRNQLSERYFAASSPGGAALGR